MIGKADAVHQKLLRGRKNENLSYVDGSKVIGMTTNRE